MRDRIASNAGSPARRRDERGATFSPQNGRLIHTLRIILTQPRELAREIDEGRDRLSMRPLTLLIHLAAFFFLVSTFTGFGVDVITRADGSGALAAIVAGNAERFPPALYHERLERRFQAIYTLFALARAFGADPFKLSPIHPVVALLALGMRR